MKQSFTVDEIEVLYKQYFDYKCAKYDSNDGDVLDFIEWLRLIQENTVELLNKS